jgi:hypothetical protein
MGFLEESLAAGVEDVRFARVLVLGSVRLLSFKARGLAGATGVGRVLGRFLRGSAVLAVGSKH